MSFLLEHMLWLTFLTSLAAFGCYVFRAGPQTRYVIWLLLLAKLLIAPVLFWPFSIDQLWQTWAEDPPSNTVVVDQQNSNIIVDANKSGGNTLGADPPTNVNANETSIASHLVAIWPTMAILLAGIWIAGILITGLVYVKRVLSLFSRCTQVSETSTSLLVDVKRIADRMGTAVPVVKMVDGIGTPAVIWFGRTYLLWPGNDDLADSECKNKQRRELWLTHEFAHLKRYDHVLGWIETSALVLWWWLPLTYWIVRELQIATECCCDCMVKRALPNNVSRYAHFLIEAVGRTQATRLNHLAAGFWSDKSALTFRLKALLETGKSNRRWISMVVGCLGLVMLPHVSTFLPAKQITGQNETDQKSVTQNQDEFESHMSYLVRNGGRWRASNPGYSAGADQPKTFRYEFSWGTNKSIVKAKIIGEYEGDSESTYSEIVVFWHPETKDMTLHHYGSTGEFGKGTTSHLPDGNELIQYTIVGRDGTRSQHQYLNDRISNNQFVTHQKMKKDNEQWRTLPELTWNRIR